MSRVLATLGLLVSLVCVFFFARATANHWASVSGAHWGSLVWVTMAACVAMYMATYILASYAWGRSLKAMSHPIPYRNAIRILMLSQFAKYLPGNIGQHVGRVVLAKRVGLPTDTVLRSMVLDTLVLLTASGLCSLSALWVLLRVVSAQGPVLAKTLTVMAAGGFAALAVIAFLPITRRFVVRQIRHIQQLIQVRTLPLLGEALVAHICSLLIGGAALYLLCLAFVPTPHHGGPWLDVCGIYSAAWLLGFLVPGAPAGLGVREMALLLGLTPLFGLDASTAAAAALRLVTTGGDGLVFVLSLILRKAIPSSGCATKGTDATD